VPTVDKVLRTVSGSDEFNANSGHAQIVEALCGPMNKAIMYWKAARGSGTGDSSYICGVASFKTVPNNCQ
jgi:hypothetical protein